MESTFLYKAAEKLGIWYLINLYKSQKNKTEFIAAMRERTISIIQNLLNGNYQLDQKPNLQERSTLLNSPDGRRMSLYDETEGMLKHIECVVNLLNSKYCCEKKYGQAPTDIENIERLNAVDRKISNYIGIFCELSIDATKKLAKFDFSIDNVQSDIGKGV